jgi:hypothetical protein
VVTEDALGQRAGARAGAISVACGVAAVESMRSGKAIKVRPLLQSAMDRIDA